jgi:hypothetical protein
MSNILYKSIAKKVSNQINNYNPEEWIEYIFFLF